MIVVLSAATRVATPWKNGGGITREVAVSPEGAGMDDFDWRVSVAEIEADGPFSALPDTMRSLTLIEGGGMELTIGGSRHVLRSPFAPLEFPGDVPTDCRLLDGRTQDFNVMWRRHGRAPSVAVVRGTLRSRGADVLVVALAGNASIRGSQDVALGRLDAARLTGEDAVVEADGPTAVIEL